MRESEIRRNVDKSFKRIMNRQTNSSDEPVFTAFEEKSSSTKFIDNPRGEISIQKNTFFEHGENN